MPFPIPLASSSRGGERVVLFLSDVPLLVLAALVLPGLARDLAARRAPLGVALWSAIVGLLIVGYAFHPSLVGVEVLGRTLGLLAVAATVAGAASLAVSLLAVVVVGSAAFQTAVAVLQVVQAAPIGLTALGEWQDPLFARGDALAPRGTTVHAYLLAAIALTGSALAAWRALASRASAAWIAAAGVAVVPLGLTFSRTAAVGFALGASFLVPAVRSSRTTRVLLATLLVCAIVPAIAEHDGWLERVDQSLIERPADADTDRRILARQAVALIAGSPVVGIGTGRYEQELIERQRRGEPTIGPAQTPHDVPLLLGAEAGVATGTVVVMLLVALGARAMRAGGAAAYLFFAVALFFVFDDFPVTHDQGIVLAGIWIGMLDRLARVSAAEG